MLQFPHLPGPLFLDGFALTLAQPSGKLKNKADIVGGSGELLSLSADGTLGLYDRKNHRFHLLSLPDLERQTSGRIFADRIWVLPDGRVASAWVGETLRVTWGPLVPSYNPGDLRVKESSPEGRFSANAPAVSLGERPVWAEGATHPSGTFAFCGEGTLHLGHAGADGLEQIRSCPLSVAPLAWVSLWPGEREVMVVAWDRGQCRVWWSRTERAEELRCAAPPIRRGDRLIWKEDQEIRAFDLGTGSTETLGSLPNPVEGELLVGKDAWMVRRWDGEDLIDSSGALRPRKLGPKTASYRRILSERARLASRIAAEDGAGFEVSGVRKEGDKLSAGIGKSVPLLTWRSAFAAAITEDLWAALYVVGGFRSLTPMFGGKRERGSQYQLDDHELPTGTEADVRQLLVAKRLGAPMEKVGSLLRQPAYRRAEGKDSTPLMEPAAAAWLLGVILVNRGVGQRLEPALGGPAEALLDPEGSFPGVREPEIWCRALEAAITERPGEGWIGMTGETHGMLILAVIGLEQPGLDAAKRILAPWKEEGAGNIAMLERLLERHQAR